MKKKLLLKLVASMITASMLLTGCGEQKTDAENVNSTVAQESETYVQNEEGEKSYTNIDWTWSVSDYELYNTMMKQEEANSELFSGIINYSDGHQETVKADSVNLIWEDGSTMVVEVEFRGKKFPYKVEIKEIWGDGESLSEEEIETFKQESSSDLTDGGSSAEKVIYSTAEDVFASDDYAYIFDLVTKDKSIDLAVRRTFIDEINQLVEDMETWGNLNEFRKFTSLEDFYTFYDEMYAPYGLDRAHRDETNAAAQERLKEIVNEENQKKLDERQKMAEESTYTIGDTVLYIANGSEYVGEDGSKYVNQVKIDEGTVIVKVIITAPTGEVVNEDEDSYYLIPSGLDWEVPEKGTVYDYSSFLELNASYLKAIKSYKESNKIN